MSKISFAQRTRSIFPSFCPRSIQHLGVRLRDHPIGEAATILYDDMSTNSSNGPTSPTVVESGDKEGPIEEMPECAFYMYAPQLHWTIAMGVEDKPARFAIESIAHE